MGALVWRDVWRGYAGGGATLVVAFFLLVAVLFPFAIGPDASLLARVGGRRSRVWRAVRRALCQRQVSAHAAQRRQWQVRSIYAFQCCVGNQGA